MSLLQKYRNILSGILPAGVVGVSMLLGSTVPSLAKEHPRGLQPPTWDTVSERLAAIRGAVSALAEEGKAAEAGDSNLRLAWGNWWRNGGWWRPWRGWGWPNWPNWHNWSNWPNWWRNW